MGMKMPDEPQTMSEEGEELQAARGAGQTAERFREGPVIEGDQLFDDQQEGRRGPAAEGQLLRNARPRRAAGEEAEQEVEGDGVGQDRDLAGQEQRRSPLQPLPDPRPRRPSRYARRVASSRPRPPPLAPCGKVAILRAAAFGRYRLLPPMATTFASAWRAPAPTSTPASPFSARSGASPIWRSPRPST